MNNDELQQLSDLLDSLDLCGSRKEMLLEPLEETPIGMFETPSQIFRRKLEPELEKSRKWLQKNYPRKPKEPRQLKEDPDSQTFI